MKHGSMEAGKEKEGRRVARKYRSREAEKPVKQRNEARKQESTATLEG